MRPLTLDLDRLVQAMDSREPTAHFLDLDSGAVLAVAPGEPPPGAEEKYQVQDDRYLPIEPLGLAEAVAMREAFLFTQHNPHAHTVLAGALNDRRPLRSFDFELRAFPEVKAAWECYQAVQLREYALTWLHEHGIEDARR